MILRPYQIELSTVAVAFLKRGIDYCIALPAQTGKSITYLNTIKKGDFVALVVTPRKFITFQGANDALDIFDRNKVSFINSKFNRNKISEEIRGKQVVVMDLQTALNRIKSGHLNKHHFDLLVVDEAHFSAKNNLEENDKTVDLLKKEISHCPTLNVTATPFDEKGRYLETLGKINDDFSPRYMVENGFLSELIIYHVDVFNSDDFEGLSRGRYTDSAIARMANSKKGILLTEIALKYTFENKFIIRRGERALVYASSIEQAEWITREFVSRKHRAKCVHSKVDNSLEIVNEFNKNGFEILVSVDMLIMGIAIKNVKKSISYRPVGSRVTEMQVKARGAGGDRKSTKIPNVFIDFTDTFSRLGHPHDFKPYWGEKEPNNDPKCKNCEANLKEIPMEVIEVYEQSGFYFAKKRCRVCGTEIETQRTTKKEEVIIDEFNLVPATRKKEIAQKAVDFHIQHKINLIEQELIRKGIGDAIQIANFLRKTAKSKITKCINGSFPNKNYLDEILEFIKRNSQSKIIIGISGVLQIDTNDTDAIIEKVKYNLKNKLSNENIEKIGLALKKVILKKDKAWIEKLIKISMIEGRNLEVSKAIVNMIKQNRV